jgi:hypothetical protein
MLEGLFHFFFVREGGDANLKIVGLVKEVGLRAGQSIRWIGHFYL